MGTSGEIARYRCVHRYWCGSKGTPSFGENIKTKKLSDPLPEAEEITNTLLKGVDYSFFGCALGSEKSRQVLNVEKNKGRSSLLYPTKINIEDEATTEMAVDVNTLDELLKAKFIINELG